MQEPNEVDIISFSLFFESFYLTLLCERLHDSVRDHFFHFIRITKNYNYNETKWEDTKKKQNKPRTPKLLIQVFDQNIRINLEDFWLNTNWI